MKRALRIAIHTSGRFHVCDLARELAILGHDIRFHSIVPPWRTRQFGLPSRCNRWMLPRIVPWLCLARIARRTKWHQWIDEKTIEELDRAVERTMEPCDVFIGMSGMCNLSAAAAKRKYGAMIFIERASRHILSQKTILERILGASQVPGFAVRRELIDYQHADILNVPAQHCIDSFSEFGFAKSQLNRNPFGTNLTMFQATPAPQPVPPTILMTGTWCLRKGCDTLSEAWKQLPGTKLLHVGPVGDCKLPKDKNFEHVKKVDQAELPRYYAKAHAFALASREEGLAFVLPQALACGLKLVCSDRTGGADLQEMIADPTAVRVIPHDNPDALAEALRTTLNECVGESGLRDRLGETGRTQLTWRAYARRYESEIYRRLFP